MTTIREHIPSFVSGFEPSRSEFNDISELSNIDFVKERIEMPKFKNLSYSGDTESEGRLMAEFNNGEFWVLGFCSLNSLKRLGLKEFKNRETIK